MDRFCGPRLGHENIETSGDFSTPFGTGAGFDSSTQGALRRGHGAVSISGRRFRPMKVVEQDARRGEGSDFRVANFFFDEGKLSGDFWIVSKGGFEIRADELTHGGESCLLYTSPSPRDRG